MQVNVLLNDYEVCANNVPRVRTLLGWRKLPVHGGCTKRHPTEEEADDYGERHFQRLSFCSRNIRDAAVSTGPSVR